MPNPITTLCRKASSFRDLKIIKKTRKFFPNGAKRQSGGIIGCKVDRPASKSTISVDDFLRHVCPLQSPVAKLEDEILESIFSHLEGKDILTTRLVCRRFNTLILTSPSVRPVIVEQICLSSYGPEGNMVCRGGIGEWKGQNTAMPIGHVHRPLRLLKTDEFIYSSLIVTHELVSTVLRGANLPMSSVVFDSCKFGILPSDLTRLVSLLRPDYLRFTNCTWLEDRPCPMSNSLLAANPSIHSLIVTDSVVSCLFAQEITDDGLRNLLSRKSLPRTVYFSGSTGITAAGVIQAVRTFVSRILDKSIDDISDGEPDFIWHFGRIQDSLTSLRDRLPGQLLVTNSERLEVVCRPDKSLPGLLVSMEFALPAHSEPFHFVEDDDIPFDDSIMDDDFDGVV